MMNTTLRCLGFGRTAQAASTPAVLPSTFERKHMHQQVIRPEEFIWGGQIGVHRKIHTQKLEFFRIAQEHNKYGISQSIN